MIRTLFVEVKKLAIASVRRSGIPGNIQVIPFRWFILRAVTMRYDLLIGKSLEILR